MKLGHEGHQTNKQKTQGQLNVKEMTMDHSFKYVCSIRMRNEKPDLR